LKRSKQDKQTKQEKQANVETQVAAVVQQVEAVVVPEKVAKPKPKAKAAAATLVASAVAPAVESQKKVAKKPAAKSPAGKKSANAKPKTKKVKLEGQDELVKKKPKTFKGIFEKSPSEIVMDGRYCGYKPKQAASKALSSIMHYFEVNKIAFTTIKFGLYETTRGSPHKKYWYEGSRKQLALPVRLYVIPEEILNKNLIPKSSSGKTPKYLSFAKIEKFGGFETLGINKDTPDIEYHYNNSVKKIKADDCVHLHHVEIVDDDQDNIKREIAEKRAEKRAAKKAEQKAAKKAEKQPEKQQPEKQVAVKNAQKPEQKSASKKPAKKQEQELVK